MRKLKSVSIIQVIIKTILGLLFFRAYLNLMVAITAIKAQTVGLSVVLDLFFRGVKGGYLEVSAGLMAVLVILTLIARIKLHWIITNSGIRGCSRLLKLRDLVRKVGFMLELRVFVFTDTMLDFFMLS
jgi:hypothetical protein